MNLWLQIFAARAASGEKLRKAQSVDYRYGFSILIWFGVMVLAGKTSVGDRFMQNASSFLIWLAMVLFGILFIFIFKIWLRRVPSGILLALAVAIWTFILCDWYSYLYYS